MTLRQWIKVDGKPARQIDESEIKILGQIIDKMDAYFRTIDVLGFYPYSVWVPKSFGEYQKYVEEYVKHPYIQKQVKTARTIWSVPDKGVKIRERIRTSFLHPKMSERVFKLWSRPKHIIYNPFLGYKIDYLIANKLERNFIGADIDPNVVKLNQEFYEKYKSVFARPGTWSKFYVQDATNMEYIDTHAVDLIFTSPPYWGAEVYPWEDPHEMSKAPSYEDFLNLMEMACKEMYRVLKPNRYAIINIADTRRENNFYPLHVDIVNLMRKAGFKPHDIVIWVNRTFVASYLEVCMTHEYTRKVHEYILVFKKV